MKTTRRNVLKTIAVFGIGIIAPAMGNTPKPKHRSLRVGENYYLDQDGSLVTHTITKDYPLIRFYRDEKLIGTLVRATSFMFIGDFAESAKIFKESLLFEGNSCSLFESDELELVKQDPNDLPEGGLGGMEYNCTTGKLSLIGADLWMNAHRFMNLVNGDD